MCIYERLKDLLMILEAADKTISNASQRFEPGVKLIKSRNPLLV
jgi:hypothetical protein